MKRNDRRQVLICGATGFIGRNLAERLVKRSDLRVRGIYHRRPPYELPGLEWHQADLTMGQDVDRVLDGVSVLVQAAATTSGSKDIVNRPHIHVTDNAVMNSLLLRAAFEKKVEHVVFFSCTVMLASSEKALTEDDFDANAEIHPRYFGAGWTKLYIEKMCEFYARIGRAKHTVIRHSNIYGPYDKFDLERSHVFGATVTKTMTARDGKVVVWGTGEEARDLLYIGDLVDFVERAVDRQQASYRLYNCGYGKAISVKEIVRKIVEKSGRDLVIQHDLSQPSINTSLFLDCSRAKQELEWEPMTDFDQGIDKTLAWWRVHIAPGLG